MANDKKLIARAQSGDEQAFAHLMRTHYAFVYAIVIGIVDNPNDAEEVVQDTFLNAYRGLAQYEEQAKFRSWLAKIARNRSLNWLRVQKMNTVSIHEVEEHTLEAPNTLDDQLIRDEQRELIRRAMETLSQKDREIAHSYYLDGASYDELTRTHGLSYKAIAFRLSRAKQRLAKRLQYLLTGLSVPPATTLKQIYSGGLTAMKIGTVPKIAAGVIGIVALIFIGFIGIRQMTAPNVEQRVYLVPEYRETAPTPNQTEQWVAQTDTTPDAEIRENQPQITAEEVKPIENFLAQLEEEEIEDFLAQLEETDVQFAETESEQDANENVNTSSAEDVMNAYVDALRDLDIEVMSSLSTGHLKEGLDNPAADDIQIIDPDELRNELIDLPKDLPVEMREMAEQHIQSTEQQILSAESELRRTAFKFLSQVKVVHSEYVGDEFHFELGGPTPEMPEIPGIAISKVTAPNELYKMRKENGAWRVYDNETLD